jgi:hypothetical protein
LKWPFIEPYTNILGKSAGHVKHPAPATSGPGTSRPRAAPLRITGDHGQKRLFRKVLKKYSGSGIKETPF